MTIKWNEVTWYSKLLAAIFLLGVVPVLTFYIGTQYEATIETIGSSASPGSSPSPSIGISLNAGPSSDHHVDPKFPFALSYPADFAFADTLAPAEQKTLVTYMGACPLGGAYREPDERGFCYIGRQSSDGFAAAALTVTASTTVDASSCQKPQQNNNGQLTRQTEINGTTFLEDMLADAGLGHYLSIDSYRTYHGGTCYTIDLKVESDRGVSEQGLGADFAAMMHSKLKAILSTFAFTD